MDGCETKKPHLNKNHFFHGFEEFPEDYCEKLLSGMDYACV
jgi:hypothetical protein